MGGAAAPQDVKSLEDALDLHDDAHDGDRRALRPAIMALRRLRRTDPWDAKSAVYLGSAYAVAVRDGWFGPSRLINVIRAVHHLDAALDFAPDSFDVRMVRASVQRGLPKVFGRKVDAIRDGIILDQMFRQAKDPHPKMALAMLSIYDFLVEAVPSKTDWDEGRQKAREAIEDASRPLPAVWQRN